MAHMAKCAQCGGTTKGKNKLCGRCAREAERRESQLVALPPAMPRQKHSLVRAWKSIVTVFVTALAVLGLGFFQVWGARPSFVTPLGTEKNALSAPVEIQNGTSFTFSRVSATCDIDMGEVDMPGGGWMKGITLSRVPQDLGDIEANQHNTVDCQTMFRAPVLDVKKARLRVKGEYFLFNVWRRQFAATFVSDVDPSGVVRWVAR